MDDLTTLQKDLDDKMAEVKTNFNNLNSKITNDLTTCVTNDCDDLRTSVQSIDLPSDVSHNNQILYLTGCSEC